MKLTKKRAKELSLEVWEYLRDHPDIDDKNDLPDKIFKKIVDMDCYCPLCEHLNQWCCDCPLKSCDDKSNYHRWCWAKTDKKRALYAAKIVEKIKSW